ncbi:adenosine deaminase [Pontimonas sp.]|nr:adenosine deaminase [Pontimonas sp.]
MANTDATSIDFQALPKISLHDHLDGGLRPATILEIADAEGVALPTDVETGAAIDDAGRLGQWFADRSDSGSLVEYLKTFDVTTAVMQSDAGLERIAREFVEDLVADGVVVGEIRWAPEQHVQGGLSLDAAVEAVQAGIDGAVGAARKAGSVIYVGQLVTAMRHLNRSVEIAQLALRHRDKGVVGFDIAGPEQGFPPHRFVEAFDLLAREMFPVTIHAGEADGVESIRSALVDGRALRLGHGVRIAEDIGNLAAADSSEADLGWVARWVLERGIPLETSPSSNIQTGAIEAWGTSMEDHPFDALYRLGFAVTVNTDNRLMSATTLTKELELLVDAFGYGIEDLLAFQLNAAQGAFLQWGESEEIIDLLLEAYTPS